MTIDRLKELNKACHEAHKAVSRARNQTTRADAKTAYDVLNAERQLLMSALYPTQQEARMISKEV